MRNCILRTNFLHTGRVAFDLSFDRTYEWCCIRYLKACLPTIFPFSSVGEKKSGHLSSSWMMSEMSLSHLRHWYLVYHRFNGFLLEGERTFIVHVFSMNFSHLCLSVRSIRINLIDVAPHTLMLLYNVWLFCILRTSRSWWLWRVIVS